ncbi:hypothetical protein DFH07DRAFT_781989 [Mycena maculata]|uniref:AB hydrolase-1 domain-containing protein n=1 Tax=Mycena maculata TaxID=230809 RepID=A0AAD7HX24_9AGAR|nr:hypothetical protein DFH07DRAFT_781989 [Mycena maculata]
MSYQIQTHTILFQPRTGLYSLANQYIPQDRAPDGFWHFAYKEQWEVVIARIFELFPGRVNKMWAIDWQNHGDSAVMNDHTLQTKAASLTLAIFQISLPISPIVAVILFEPVHILQPVTAGDERILKGQLNIWGVKLRQTTFASREDASVWARKRMPWKTWDDCPLKSTDQEIWQCEPNVPIMAGHLYTKLCATFPVHRIFGQHPDMYSNATRDRFFDGKEGRTMASAQIIPRAGHLLVQEKPDTAAEMVVLILGQVQVDQLVEKARL